MASVIDICPSVWNLILAMQLQCEKQKGRSNCDAGKILSHRGHGTESVCKIAGERDGDRSVTRDAPSIPAD
uniref:Uncharacterized protein n=1 Tax=Oryza sativa subsp. japonica TaxID=39947 RepID=Q6ZHG8_ORYSJ|nr:hypothetical protein [Oryza sativa Japonica Group]